MISIGYILENNLLQKMNHAFTRNEFNQPVPQLGSTVSLALGYEIAQAY